MLLISTFESLQQAVAMQIAPKLRALITQRYIQLTGASGSDLTGLGRFVVVEPHDAPESIEREIGFSVIADLSTGHSFGEPDFTPSWEWCEDHGDGFELVFIFTDDGFAHVLFVPNDEEVDATLLAMCREHCRRSNTQSAADPPASLNGPTEL